MPSRHVLAAAAGAAVLAAGCSGSAGASGAAASPPDATVAALCRARAQAGTPAEAAATFDRDAHADLHAIADEVTAVDRATAGELLVAKNEVESLLAGQPEPDELRQRLDDLVAATRTALDVLGTPVAGCDG